MASPWEAVCWIIIMSFVELVWTSSNSISIEYALYSTTNRGIYGLCHLRELVTARSELMNSQWIFSRGISNLKTSYAQHMSLSRSTHDNWAAQHMPRIYGVGFLHPNRV